LFAVYAGTTPSKAHEVLGLIREQLEDVATHGVSDEELERAKGHMAGSLVLSLEDTSGRMSRLGKSEIAGGEILTVNEVLKRVHHVTPEQARHAASKILSQPMAMTVLGPFKKGEFKGENPAGVSLTPEVDTMLEAAAHHAVAGARA
jgi:predicted Zn-dependent peptidase